MAHFPIIDQLGPEFYDPVSAAPFSQFTLRFRNDEAFQGLGIDSLSDTQWLERFGKFNSIENNLKQPLALRYHGHQFLHYNPELGDGRGFLFAQFKTNNDKILDLGTKGSGQTPYSRKGDGRLTLKGAFREILATELLAAHGVNTSKTLSVIETHENLIRYDEPSPTRSAVLVRVCHSHIRFGTFQRLAYLGEIKNIQKLTEYCIQHYFPESSKTNPVESFFKQVVENSTDLVASWMSSGFVHGVMNTDNMNITGECFDYGPYRFLPFYDPNFVAAYFDHQGLYRFGRQPITMLWNLERLGESLKLAFPELDIQNPLENFSDLFHKQINEHCLRRLNLKNSKEESDLKLAGGLFSFMEKSKASFEQTFFDLTSGVQSEKLANSPQSEKYQGDDFNNLCKILNTFEILNSEKMNLPYYQQSKACTVLIDEIETIWKEISTNDDWTLFHNKISEIRKSNVTLNETLNSSIIDSSKGSTK